MQRASPCRYGFANDQQSGKTTHIVTLSFEDGFKKTFAVTDADGVAEVTYVGPTRDEIPFDTFVTIQGQPETDWVHVKDPYDPLDDPSEFYIHKEMDIRLIKGTGTN